MSPEQIEGEPDKRRPALGPVQLLGVILWPRCWHVPSCQLPRFGLGAVMVVRSFHFKGEDAARPSQMRPDLDPRIEAVCLKMLAKKPSERFASLKAVADELAAILKSPAAASRSLAKNRRGTSAATAPPSPRTNCDGGRRMPVRRC